MIEYINSLLTLYENERDELQEQLENIAAISPTAKILRTRKTALTRFINDLKSIKAHK